MGMSTLAVKPARGLAARPDGREGEPGRRGGTGFSAGFPTQQQCFTPECTYYGSRTGGAAGGKPGVGVDIARSQRAPPALSASSCLDEEYSRGIVIHCVAL